ncbi:hypothetical protein AC578_5508 [Pseudocercospora eumusae]|uniref:HhH-GPD domain-containing protein n=1 Tax=Pseudocercospora eumusae TaxID=321146 RepID=A0A139H806_9PEZI|nr:hypothetical protein AC578_5508 [Pseudocercospora eumusae]
MAKKRSAHQSELEHGDRPQKRVKASPVSAPVQQQSSVDGDLQARRRKRKHDKQFRRARAAPTPTIVQQQSLGDGLSKTQRKRKLKREKRDAFRAEAKLEMLPDPRLFPTKTAGGTQLARVPVDTDIVLDLAGLRTNAQQYKLDWPFAIQQAHSRRNNYDLQLKQLPPKQVALLEKFYRPSHALVKIEETTPPRNAPLERPQQPRIQAQAKPFNAFKPYVEPRISSVSLYRGDEDIEATKARLRRSFNISRGRPADASSDSSSSSESSTDSESDEETKQNRVSRGSFQESWAKKLADTSDNEQIQAAEDSKDIVKDALAAQASEVLVGDDEADQSRHETLPLDQQFTLDENGEIVLAQLDPIPLLGSDDESSNSDSSVDAELEPNEDGYEHLDDVDAQSGLASDALELEAQLPEDPADRQANTGISEQLNPLSDPEMVPSSPPQAAAPHEPGQNDLLDTLEGYIDAMPVSESTSANIGMKRSERQITAEEAGSSQTKTPPTEQVSPTTSRTVDVSKYRYGHGDPQDTQELYDDIDNVAQDLFQSTRPLPQGTLGSTRSSDLRRDEQHLTRESSDVRQDVSCNSLSTDRATVADVHNASQGSSDDLETETDSDYGDPNTREVQEVAMKNNTVTNTTDHDTADAGMYDSDGDEIEVDDAEANLLARRSSAISALTELAKTPSPPPEIVLPKAVQEAIAIANGTSSPSVPASAKKRQMTGRTSKHFSPPKPLPSKEPRKRSVANGYKTYEKIPDRIGYVDLGMHVTRSATSSLPQPEFEKRDETSSSDVDVEEEVGVPAQVQVDFESCHDESVPAASKNRRKTAKAADEIEHEEDSSPMPPSQKRRSSAKKRKTTGAISEHFITDRVDKFNTTGKNRIAGVSYAPTPSINEKSFGLIQEKIWNEPFWLIIAVTFLNKTAGRSAVPVFWKIRQKWPQPYLLAQADSDELLRMIHHLGLQNQRCKRIKQIAHAWASCPPALGKRFRTLHYPNKGDGKHYKKDEIIEGDADDCVGAVELAHIPGCGRYAIDSWRIFCRDVMRGLAKDYNGSGCQKEDFEPEWKRVVPQDKELRACLRWMWLREGYIWDALTGDKREATGEEMENAVKGQMEIEDEVERKFAAQAAGVAISSPEKARRGDLGETPVKEKLSLAEAPPDDVDGEEIRETADAE